MKRVFAIALGLLPVLAAAGEDQFQLKEGPGRERVMLNCMTCHSLDYIAMNSVFLDRKGWEASVNKMIKVMGAPVPEQDVEPILDYLARFYGR